MKQIIINTCRDCPHAKEGRVNGPYCNNFNFVLGPAYLLEGYELPDWCPLEDAE